MSCYDSSFTPAYKPGHTLKAHHGTTTTHVRVVAVRAMGVHEHDWAALTANTLASNQRCTHLQLQDGEIGQYRFVVKQPMWVFLKHPAAARFMSSKGFSDSTGEMWGINQWEADRGGARVLEEYNFMASEFWVWEDNDPRFDVLPLKSSQSPQGYVEFMGWRYKVDPIDHDGEVDLWMDSWPWGRE